MLGIVLGALALGFEFLTIGFQIRSPQGGFDYVKIIPEKQD